MHRPYRSKDGLKVEGLTVLYAADNEGVMLIWSNDWMTYLPAKGDLDLDLGFKKGAAVGQSWGTRRLHYDKVDGTYYFRRAFSDADESRRVLCDRAVNDSIGLLLGPQLITNLPLDASAAIEKLRECSLNGGRAP